MDNSEICLLEQVFLARGAGLRSEPYVEVFGRDYLDQLEDPALLAVALSDLRAIKEVRPDLGDFDLAYLVRTADDDDDAEAWCRRVMSYKAQRSHVA